MVELSTGQSVVADTRHRIAFGAPEVLLFGFGVVSNCYAYASSQPLMLMVLVWVVANLMLSRAMGRNFEERRIFNRVFSVSWFMAGVAALYAEVLQDNFQLFSDAANFYELASGQDEILALEQLRSVREGSLSIFIWRAFYDFVGLLGFERARFVGTTLNILAVAATSVIALKMARQLFGEDQARFQTLRLLFSCCGLLWLFAGVHVRDGIILLAITALSAVWLYFLESPKLTGRRFIALLLASAIGFVSLGFLRAEFVYVPIAMALAAWAAVILAGRTARMRLFAAGLMVLALIPIAAFLAQYLEDFIEALDQGRAGYQAITEGANSLGAQLIVNQVLPVRLVLGSVYLYMAPIPFWVGFQLDSVYVLFKTFNVLYFYFVSPLLLLAGTLLWRYSILRSPPQLFIVFSVVGFTIGVAGTSLEARHIGAFLVPITLLALVPDLKQASIVSAYKQYLFLVVMTMAAIHVMWLAIKL